MTGDTLPRMRTGTLGCFVLWVMLAAVTVQAFGARAGPDSPPEGDRALLELLTQMPHSEELAAAAWERGYLVYGEGGMFSAMDFALSERGEPLRDELRHAALVVARALQDRGGEIDARASHTRFWCEAVMYAAADPDDDRVVDYLRGRLRDYMPFLAPELEWDGDIRKSMARYETEQLLATLAQYGPAAAGALPEVLEISRVPDPIKGVILRDDVVSALAAMRGLAEPALPYLNRGFGDAQFRWAAMLVGGDETDPVDAVLVLFEDENWRIRRGAMSVARQEHLLDPRIVDAMLQLVREDEKEHVRHAAARELLGLGEHVDAVHAAMLDTSLAGASAYSRVQLLGHWGLDARPLLAKLREEREATRHTENYDSLISALKNGEPGEIGRVSVVPQRPGSGRKYWGDYTSAP